MKVALHYLLYAVCTFILVLGMGAGNDNDEGWQNVKSIWAWMSPANSVGSYSRNHMVQQVNYPQVMSMTSDNFQKAWTGSAAEQNNRANPTGL